MSKRTVLAIATLAMLTNFAAPVWAADKPADSKSAQHAACADHVKKMKEMKTSAERETYCKGDASCSSNHCMSMMGHHGKSKHHAATTTPAPAPKTTN